MKTIEEILLTERPKREMTKEIEEEIFKIKHGTICTKCNGTGRIPEYMHNKNGKCFSCNGTGRIR